MEHPMQISLSGRRALVTGGSKGLGYAAAEGFLRAGARVALVARGAEALEAAREALAPLGEVIAVAADVATADGCRAAFATAEAAFGGIDILLNNAGTSTRGAFTSVTDEMWQADLDLKLFGAIRLTRLAWPGMAERRWGRVINTLNTGAKVPLAQGAPTAVSRAAGLSLTKILANEGAPVGILVNAILIGIIESAEAPPTDSTRVVFAALSAALDVQLKALEAALAAGLPAANAALQAAGLTRLERRPLPPGDNKPVSGDDAEAGRKMW
jgi:NAD(P)-dependent dehydrogenase (short-subunit alcohol dehydrogenase family)